MYIIDYKFFDKCYENCNHYLSQEAIDAALDMNKRFGTGKFNHETAGYDQKVIMELREQGFLRDTSVTENGKPVPGSQRTKIIIGEKVPLKYRGKKRGKR